jgi:glutamate---cysteine ligase / carboxylate-amine ligase
MTIEWNPSAGPTLGVEWEVQLIDAKTRLLRQDASTVLAGLPGLLESGEHPKMRYELMQSTIEVVTGICGTVAEAKSDLALSLKDLQRAAEPHDIVLASSGTHAISHWRDGKMAPSQRYAELVQEIQYPSRRLQTMAVHVHVGLRDEHRAMPVINALAVYLPHLLGLSASSPYWCGEDTGLASSRSVVFGSLPHAGPPLGLPDWKSFEDYMASQLRAGTIRTIKEVWWDVRPHPDFGTVEVRIADAVPTLREVGMLAALVQCLAHLFDTQLDRGYRLPSRAAWVIADNKWRATRHGLDTAIITSNSGATAPLRDEVYELLRDLEPVAWRLGCAEELTVANEVLEWGAPYERQRATRSGDGDLTSVVDALVTEFAEDKFVLRGDGGHGG